MCNKTSRKHSFLDQTSSRRISTSRRRRTCDCATGKEGQFEQGKGHQRDTFRPLLKLFFTLMLWIHKLTLATPMDVVEEYNDHYGSITSINFVKLIVLTLISIREYNERVHNVFKYKVLKIEKVNFMVTYYLEYWMTAKVRNVTPIEIFQMHAAVGDLANCNLSS
uniref:Uncharacterized protein n=1 Tax=Solanum lycopersicum TaxID=4081 RepID=K4BHK2_SOLLC